MDIHQRQGISPALHIAAERFPKTTQGEVSQVLCPLSRRENLDYAQKIYQDVYSRWVIGWALSDLMRTEVLPLQAFNQAIVAARKRSYHH